MTKRLRHLARLALVCILIGTTLARVARAENVTVFAAASLTDAMKEIGAAYEQSTGKKVDFNFAGSNDLARQIKAGAPADIFFSADAAQMDALIEAGLIAADTRTNVLSNSLVFIVPKTSAATIDAPGALATFARIAVANPEAVPAGVYARKYLQGLGLWDAILPHVIPTTDVRAALAAVADEHADAGIVYRTDAAISPKVKTAFEVPRDQAPPIVYPVAPISASKQSDTPAVLRALLSPEARQVYERFGFIVLPGK